jgi:hypothetical protein
LPLSALTDTVTMSPTVVHGMVVNAASPAKVTATGAACAAVELTMLAPL